MAGGWRAIAPRVASTAAAVGVLGLVPGRASSLSVSLSAVEADAIHLRAGDLVIGDVSIRTFDSQRVWYEHLGGDRGSVPLSAVAALEFGTLPDLPEAERLAGRREMRAAAALLRPATTGEGAGASWASRRVVAWLGDVDPAEALAVAAERLMREGDLQWVRRFQDAAVVGASSDPGRARTVLRQIRRWRTLMDGGGIAGDVPIGAIKDVRRGLVELERHAARLLQAARAAAGEPDDPARGEASSSAFAHRSTSGGVSGSPSGPSLHTAEDVAAALRAGRVEAVLASLAEADGPDPSAFGPAVLAELGRAAERAGRPVLAAAAWLRCGVLHPRAPEATMAWEEAARLHETSLDDPAAAARIRTHAAHRSDAMHARSDRG